MGVVVSTTATLVSTAISSIVMGLTWCFCTALASLCTSCCGNDKASTMAPSVTSGRKRSVFLLFLAIGLAFAFQYGVAPSLAPNGSAITNLPKVGQYLVDTWNDGCTEYENEALQLKCSGNSGVFRVSFCSFLFFILAAMASACKPTANREAWPAKYILFLFLVLGTVFIPNKPLFSDIYPQIARIGGVIFILIQQIILIDLAYNWNESWVAKADEAELEERGSGKKWLGAILASCVILFAGSITVIGLLFGYFSGCPTNEAFISVTLIMSVIVTVVQLLSEEASLLTSGIIMAYAAYLALTAVSKNPNEVCNPKLGDEDVLGIVLGIGFSLLSLAWMGWSFTADERLQNGSSTAKPPPSVEMSFPLVEGTPTRGIVTTSVDDNYGLNESFLDSTSFPDDQSLSSVPAQSWKLNIVLALVSCWFGMALTGWGSIQVGGNAANPDVSNVTMWMIIASQWVVLSLYLWTLVAPKLFPDRDFS